MATETHEDAFCRRNCTPDISNGSGEATDSEAIQKFLTICLNHYFNSSCDTTKSFVTGETLQEQDSSLMETSSASFDGFEFTCKFCNDEMAPVSMAVKSHFDACPLYPVKCPNMCGEMSVPREKLSNHIMEECPNTHEQCIYQDIGCSFQGAKSSMAKHLKESSEEHLQLALEAMKEQRAQMHLQQNRLKKQEESISQLMESVGKLTALCEETLKDKAEKDKTINRLSEQIKEQRKHQAKHEKEIRHKIAELEKRGTEVPQNGLFRYPGLNGYGEQVWRISNFSRRLQRVQAGRSDDPITSEPFYTSAFGYKVVAWAYLNGRGKEEGKGLSIYACLASGEYDAILKWPIKPRYTFALLDQSSDTDARKDLVRMRKVHDFKRDDVRRKGIERPGRDERAIIVGFDDFVKHEELEPGNFLADDCLFIRILVDIPDS